ncbi:hypothetical protein NDU88_010652 [Pleurodeles waltl]|uniref:Carbohydrate sulfotransferase n=1 Tax=Pleurodeles waltl TaxID=8319 RepID=A0AAV7RYT9_PLEWA|nr:hypothetical protein NDU88_010652 [Pleurodeles waltl]
MHQPSPPEGGVIEASIETSLTYETLLHAQQLRKIRLKSFCSRHAKVFKSQSQKSAEGALANVVVNAKLELMYCKAPEIELDGWEQLLWGLENTGAATLWRPIVSNQSLLEAVPPRGKNSVKLLQIGNIPNYYTKILFVRDPFERLVSSYLQQFADKMPFLEFLTRRLQNSTRPWQPIVTSCHPCRIKYDHIINYKFLDIEVRHLMHKLGLQTGSWMMKLENKSLHRTHTWISQKLLNELPVEQKKELFHAFRWDFKAFQFSSLL